MVILEFLDEAKPYSVGQSIQLSEKHIHVGRYDTCQVTLDDENNTISREHAVIKQHNGEITVSNLSKTNATLVNGTPIRGTQKLKPGDVIQLSSQGPRMRFKTSEASTHSVSPQSHSHGQSQTTDFSVFDWYKMPLQKFATFKGRASRKEYWVFYLFNFLISWGLIIFDIIMINGAGIPNFRVGTFIYVIFLLALFIPSLAVLVRRLHDTGRSAAWLFIVLIPFVGAIALVIFLVQRGDTESNQFGPNPLQSISA